MINLWFSWFLQSAIGIVAIWSLAHAHSGKP
ncbi:hypothetical protein Osc7112_6362 (plasmid) [Oscillatoria nigro-viridis PCC 7112]|uniref:Uncharacterized protein n=1 Tax=Phormidium nigroviride PCC 7112 TaxID=179408 RepID=K9VTG9_9CYAN|nr:hypothetical protein Osc7112_6362 [Oscillatoria nigro-viridis PCC 7112]